MPAAAARRSRRTERQHPTPSTPQWSASTGSAEVVGPVQQPAAASSGTAHRGLHNAGTSGSRAGKGPWRASTLHRPVPCPGTSGTATTPRRWPSRRPPPWLFLARPSTPHRLTRPGRRVRAAAGRDQPGSGDGGATAEGHQWILNGREHGTDQQAGPCPAPIMRFLPENVPFHGECWARRRSGTRYVTNAGNGYTRSAA